MKRRPRRGKQTTFAPWQRADESRWAKGAWANALAFSITLSAGIVVGLAVNFLLAAFKGPTDAERLRGYVADVRSDGKSVVLNKRIDLGAPGGESHVLILRSSDRKATDRLVVLDPSRDLSTVFEFEPAGDDLAYRLSLLDEQDLAGTGASSLLLRMSPVLRKRAVPFPKDPWADIDASARAEARNVAQKSYRTYPVVLSYTTLEGFRLTPVMPKRLVVGPHRPFTRDDAQLIRDLHQRPPARFRDRTKTVPPFFSISADSFALKESGGRQYLIAGFVVAQDDVVLGEDVDCQVDAKLKRERGEVGCVGLSSRCCAPTYVNAKAFRFERAGVKVAPTACGGDATFVRVSRSQDNAALLEAWPRYARSHPAC